MSLDTLLLVWEGLASVIVVHAHSDLRPGLVARVGVPGFFPLTLPLLPQLPGLGVHYTQSLSDYRGGWT